MTDTAAMRASRLWLPAGLGAARMIPAVCGVTALYFSLACLAIAHWRATGEIELLDFCFKQIGGPLLAVLAGIELGGTVLVWRRFDRGEPLRTAWGALSAASLLHVANVGVRHILSQNIAVNPLRGLGLPAGALDHLRDYGGMIGGILFPLALAAGLALVLRRFVQLGLKGRPRGMDWIAMAAVAAYLVFEFFQALAGPGAGGVRAGAMWQAGWITDPFFAGLFIIAMLLRRANLALRGGYIARCWSAYSLAVLLTTAGDCGLSLQAGGFLGWPLAWPFWLIWHPAAAAFALAPLYQLDTMDRAAALEECDYLGRSRFL